jgi:hypothetical protein
MGERSGDAGVSELNPLAEVRQARMAGIIWDEIEVERPGCSSVVR